jgi:hypothetical protein
MAYFWRLHLLHGRRIVWSSGGYNDLGLCSRLHLLSVCLRDRRVLLARGSRHRNLWVSLLRLVLRIALGHLSLHGRVLWRIALLLVPIWLLLLRSVGDILPVRVRLLRRPVVILAGVHGERTSDADGHQKSLCGCSMVGVCGVVKVKTMCNGSRDDGAQSRPRCHWRR